MDSDDFARLVRRLTALQKESEWVEFKHNNADPQKIGETISAVSNSAALLRETAGYLLWGVQDEEHRLVGTTFRPRQAKKGNEEVENWLVTQLKPPIDVQIHEGLVDDRHIVLFEVQPASNTPVRFRGTEYVRVGSYTKKLADHPEKERALWALFSEVPFEAGIAALSVASDDVLSLIDYPEYFRLTNQPLPDNRAAIMERLAADSIIQRKLEGRYDITNVGAILFARSLGEFRRLDRKALRVVIYGGDNRVEAIREQKVTKGYAIGFEGAVQWINDQLPQSEEIGQALRREARMYPEIAVRELAANALIHQDLAITGAGPMVEIFSDRMEVSNPGVPLIETLRFIDEPPRSRNEALAGLMRRMNICEERGSGIDKVVTAVEAYQLPAPDFRVAGSSTVAVLYGPRGFSRMDREERIRACYQHACLRYVTGKRMTNASLRERLGIDEANYPQAWRVIRDAIEMRLVKPHGNKTPRGRSASYVPFWA